MLIKNQQIETKMADSHQLNASLMYLHRETMNFIETNGDTTALKLVEMKKGGSL